MDLNDVDFEPDDDVIEGSQDEGSSEYDDLPGVVTTTSVPDPTDGSGADSSDGNQTSPNTTDAVMAAYLKYNGIPDPEKIKFQDDDGIVKERSWNDLSFEEKMNILTTSQEQPERDLDDNEIAFINDMRSRKISPQQYIDTIRQQAAQDYADQQAANPQYKVADLSDDEIFILDLQDKLDDDEVTDEEILVALNKAKEDPLYEKRIAGMRKALEAQEQTYLAEQQAEQQQQQEDQFNQFKSSVVNSIQGLNRIGDLDINLDKEDQEDIAAFILDRDDTGMSYMGKALNDPQTLVEMAFWTLKGRDTVNSISAYFANEIKNARQTSYQKGLEDGRKGTSKVVYKPQGVPNQGKETTIDDIWG